MFPVIVAFFNLDTSIYWCRQERENLMQEIENLNNWLQEREAKKSKWYVGNCLEILELVLKSYCSGVRGQVSVRSCNQSNVPTGAFMDAILVDDDQQRERCMKVITRYIYFGIADYRCENITYFICFNWHTLYSILKIWAFLSQP